MLRQLHLTNLIPESVTLLEALASDETTKQAQAHVNFYSAVPCYMRTSAKDDKTSSYSPEGNYCSQCDAYNHWCIHIRPPQEVVDETAIA